MMRNILIRSVIVYSHQVRKASHSGVSLMHRPPISVFGISGRYVSALYSAALEQDQLDAVEKALASMAPILLKQTVKDFIETSIIPRAEKAKILSDIAKSAGLPDTATNFLAAVAENGRLKMLRQMINQFLTVMVAHRRMALCEVITAAPLDSASREKVMETLKKLAKGKNIQLTEKVDQSIIGGIIVGIEDKHIDMSINRKIQMYAALMKEAF